MFKQYAAGTALGLFLTGGMVGTANATLLTNGTFDTDLSGWTVDGSTTTGVTWDSGTAHVGRPGTPGTAIFEQAFDIPAGTRQLVTSFDYEWQVVQPSIEDLFEVELIYETTAGAVTTGLLNEGSDSGTFNTTVNFADMVALSDLNTAVSPNGEIRFTLTENNADRGTRIQLDNVSVQAVPAPTSLALLACGLMALGLRRRQADS